MKNVARIIAGVSVVALSVAACGSKPKDNSGPTPGGSGGSPSTPTQTASHPNFRACMVSDSGGFDDKSFNQTSYKGLTDAVSALGLKVSKVESNSNSDYVNNVNAMVQAKCNIVVTVGFLLADATQAAAKKNPNIDFAIVDNAFTKPGKNLKSLEFNTAQSSYLAGYLAAGMTKTGKVGTFGGLPIPTVTIFMDGFWEGVQKYNADNNKNVQVLGWNEKTQKGSFTQDFESKTKGASVASTLINQGADIIFPVAGPAGLGALQDAKNSGGKVNAIWVDTDGCVSAAAYCSVLLSSVQKGMDVAVKKTITAAVDRKFTNQPFVGTLANGGTNLAPYHDWDSKIPSDLKTKIDQLKQDIISGKIKIKSKAQPAS